MHARQRDAAMSRPTRSVPPAGAAPADVPTVQVVTGKGGVGKTAVAVALALAAAHRGLATLLVDVEGRGSPARALGEPEWDERERPVRSGLWAASLDPTAAVLEYLDMFHGLRVLPRALERAHAIEFVTAAAPGLRDLLLVGKVYEIEARRQGSDRRRYDTIVVDAPPTGRIVPFLGSPASVTEIVRVGQIRRQAAQITGMLRDPARTRVLMVTLLEDLAVTEAVEGLAALAAAGIATGPLVVNRVEPEVASARAADRVGRIGRRRTRERLAEVGLAWADADVDDMRAAVAWHRIRQDRQARMRGRLAATGTSRIELPRVAPDQQRVARALVEHVAPLLDEPRDGLPDAGDEVAAGEHGPATTRRRP